MKAIAWIVAAGFTAIACAEEPAPEVVKPPDEDPVIAAQKAVVTSRSKQFKVSGGDGLMRGSAAILAERTKDELLHLTEEEDQWKVGASIVLHGKEGDPLPESTTATRLVWIDEMPTLRLDVHLGEGLDEDRFKRAVTELLIYQRCLEHGKHKPTDAFAVVPPWLSVGLCEASAWRLDETDRTLYAALFKRGGVFKLDELLSTTTAELAKLDGATRAAYRVSSGALVMALLEQPEGKRGFRDFLKEVATYQGDMPILLRKHFPDLNLSENSLAKWWALQLANKGGLNLLSDVLTIQETEKELKQALQFSIPSGGGLQQKGLSAWKEVAELEGDQRFAAVRPAQEALIYLSYRCFPSYRPMLLEYQKLLIGLSRGKTEKLPERIQSLERSRKTMVTGAERARDYMDWFEITRARQTSGEFEDYLKLKERLKEERRVREDPVTQYLDRMNELFDRSEESEK